MPRKRTMALALYLKELWESGDLPKSQSLTSEADLRKFIEEDMVIITDDLDKMQDRNNKY